MNKEQELLQIEQQVKACRRCSLWKTAKNAVPGEGPPTAEIMFIGEGPGQNEDEQGRPFVGAAGKFLEELLHSIKMSRSSVFIGNVIKHRPPANRDPLPDEIEACWPWMQEQIRIIQPKVICTLGRFSLARFLPLAKISRDHGKPKRVGEYVILPLYHPAAALYQGSLRATLEEDFKKIPLILEKLAEIKKETAKEEKQVEQNKLF
jgi:uracil-DNA glycosylase family 4